MLRTRSPGPIAQRCQVGNQSHVPEQQRHRGIGAHREKIPHQRAAELRPHAGGRGVRDQVVEVLRAAQVQQRKQRRAGHGKQRHRFGKPIDRRAPLLPQQQQDGRDQRACVADADPPHEVDDGKSPGDRHIDSPNADATQEQHPDRPEQQHHQRERQAKSHVPAQRRSPREHDRADLVSHRTIRVIAAQELGALSRGLRCMVRGWAHASIQLWRWSSIAGLGLRNAAR